MVAIPVSAVTTVETVRGAFLAKETGYTFTPIDIGHEGSGWVEIREGLKAGDRVVTEGVFDLKNVLLREQIGSGD